MWSPNVVLFLFNLQAVATAAGPIVFNANTGISYQGSSAGGVEQFQNIFYAEDTSGINRFAPPVPYLPTRGSTVQATASGAACPQPSQRSSIYPFGSEIPDQSEDCLSLRIARPAHYASNKSLPVMAWVYGGGFTYGNTYNRLYNPTGIIQESVASGHPVIYVSPNYRVGIFGFAASDALHNAKSENVGLRDQRLALQWIKDNIAAFGGDPDNITLFGQSAGAISTGLQTLAFGGQHGVVFKKAIIDSGSIAGSFPAGPNVNATAGVAKALGCSGNGDAELACLRAVSRETLFAASVKQTNNPSGLATFKPLVDGDFIPALPSRLVLEGSFAKDVSIMVSWTENDGSQFVPRTLNTEAAVIAFYGSELNDDAIRDQLLSLYPVEDFAAEVIQDPTQTAQFYRASRIFRDLTIACRALNLTYEFSRQTSKPTFLSTFNSTRLQPVWNAENASYFRVGHTSDIPYVFNEHIVGGDNSPSAFRLSAQVSSSYSQFATSGYPSTGDFNWPVAWRGPGQGNLTIFVIGGPYGSGPVTLGSRAVTQRSKALAEENLVERCAFINAKTTIGLV